MKQIQALVEVLSPSEIEMIHQGALRIVERIGVRLPNKECLDACEAQGAVIDWERQVFTIPSKRMEEMVTKLRDSMPLPVRPQPLKELRGYLSPQVYFVDYASRSRRPGLMEDNLKGIAVLERLDYIMGNGSIVVPSEVPNYLSDILTFQTMNKYSLIGGGTYVLSPTSAKYVIEIYKALNKKTGYLFATVSPLQFSKEHVDIAMVFLKNGMGLSIGPMPIGGASAPVTIAGTITLQIAESLASLFAVYALTGHFAPFTVAAHSMDLRSMLCSFGSPNQGLIGMATAQMARFYGYSDAWTNAGLTDALLPDFQAGMEKGLTAAFSLLGGSTNIGCQGIVGADQGISLEQLVLDNEWISAFNHIVHGIEVNEDTIGLDVIEQVGIAGSYVSEQHTVRHMRQSYWSSKLFNRQSWEIWALQGHMDAAEKAHEFVADCLSTNYPHEPVVSPSLAAQIDEITQAAVEELTLENLQRY